MCIGKQIVVLISILDNLGHGTTSFFTIVDVIPLLAMHVAPDAIGCKFTPLMGS